MNYYWITTVPPKPMIIGNCWHSNIKNRINQNNVNISSLVCSERELLKYVLGTAIFNYDLLISRYISLVTRIQ